LLVASKGLGRKEALLFCEQKRSKKNFCPAGCGVGRPNARRSKSFLLPRAGRLFFKKKALFFLFGLAGKAWMPAFAGMTLRGSGRF
jgi:hypothetical protein